MFSVQQSSIALAALCLLVSAMCLMPPRTSARKGPEPNLLEVGGELKAAPSKDAPESLKVVSYNIRWRGGDDLKQLIALLREDKEIGGAAVIGLQEVDRNKKRTGNVNTARQMAEALGMYYAWAAPPPPPTKENKLREEETGVAILSPYPLTDVEGFVLPNEGPGG